ncbi:hypothetical protein Hanom_Chr03g00193801 [Helianthus anomalus]
MHPNFGQNPPHHNLFRLKDNLNKARVSGFKLHYLGDMNIMISFEDDIDALAFVLNANMWKEWFETLDFGSGQSMAYERLAWLKFHDMPLHLAKNKVFNNVASVFGKIVKGSQMSLSDWDLSTNSVGILVDSGSRITGSVILKWKNKRFKVWVMEELDDWVPDCLFDEEWPKTTPVAKEGDVALNSPSKNLEDHGSGYSKNADDLIEDMVNEKDKEDETSSSKNEGAQDGGSGDVASPVTKSPESRFLAEVLEQSGTFNDEGFLDNDYQRMFGVSRPVPDPQTMVAPSKEFYFPFNFEVQLGRPNNNERKTRPKIKKVGHRGSISPNTLVR